MRALVFEVFFDAFFADFLATFLVVDLRTAFFDDFFLAMGIELSLKNAASSLEPEKKQLSSQDGVLPNCPLGQSMSVDQRPA